ADRPRTRNRDAYRARAVQPGYRDTADVVGSNRRKPHLQGDGQNRHVQPRRARDAAARAPTTARRQRLASAQLIGYGRRIQPDVLPADQSVAEVENMDHSETDPSPITRQPEQ